MTGLLGLALPPWLNPSVLALVGTGLAAAATGAYVAHRWDSGTIAQAHLDAEKVRADYRAYQASTAANAAKATAHALEQQTLLQDTNNALQAQLLAQQKEADARSKALNAILASAKPGDTRALGPSVLAFLDSLRTGKAGNTNGSGSP